MELLVGLKKKDSIEILLKDRVDGIIFGSKFSLKYNYSLDELREINEIAINNNLKRYISIDSLINEDDLDELYPYLEEIIKLNVDGVYFEDLVILNYFKEHNVNIQLIYDPSNLNTNVNDIAFFLNQNVDAVIARELTIEEIINIVKNHPAKLDLQVFGHLRMSYSKRKFLTNYFKEINKDVEFNNSDYFSLIEENREYKLPIRENKYGTCIYTDYVLIMLEELAYLKGYIKRAIIDYDFLSDNILLEVIRGIQHLTKENARFLEENIKSNHPNIDFSNGYLYQKTVDRKENE